MTKKILLLIFLAMSGLYLGCSGNSSCAFVSGSIVLSGNYDFVFTDSLNTPFLDGKMNLKVVDGDKVSGDYTMGNKYSDRPDGFSSLQGLLAGSVDSKNMSVFLNMNPKLADNNIFVNADIKQQDIIKGNWTYSTYTGTKRKGSFTAYKSK
ncbi:hypothetical protein D4R20_03255 [bacterium]|nr:MAG: hypothetical protein D4R20_03255 [bacterium]